ncbi:MAG: beta-galactosidase [Ruminococcus sp.]|nr:beta-galactosidase [Ruminococcus sp.]
MSGIKSIGADYYPEQWDENMWERDALLMGQTGIGVVRIGEFAWCRLEPDEGRFELDWLERAVNAFAKHGIKTILCTPTNCPPLWVYQKYPETLQTERSGFKTATGIRGHRCYNSSKLRKLSLCIIEKLVTRFKDNENVIAWQIDNELDAAECCCESCTEKLRRFLKDKYGSLEKINQAYGNVVWSGEYSSWEQISPPLGSYNEGWYNPGLLLDWKRFCRQNVSDFVNFQIKVIKKRSPDAQITTNTWLCENAPDYYDMFSHLDFVSFDNYPPSAIPDDENTVYSHAFHLDLMRSFKDGRSFCIMEQLSGVTGCWAPMGRIPEKGMLSGYSMQAVAHGADMVLHFRWRSAIKGAEMFWHGILDHSNEKNERLDEISKLCREFDKIKADLDGSVIKNDCAIIYSADCLDALKLQPQTEGFHYFNQLKSFHDAITSLGIGCDIVDERSDFSRYRVLIAPSLFVLNEQTNVKLHKFAKAQSSRALVFTNRSGVKGEFNECKLSPLPCELSDLTGCIVEKYDPLGYSEALVSTSFGEFKANMWSEALRLNNAKEIARFSGGRLDSLTAAAENKIDGCKVYYLGFCSPQRSFYKAFVKKLLADAGIKYIENLPNGIEITTRENQCAALTFVFNNSNKQAKAETDEFSCELEPYQMKIYRKEKT